MVNGHWQHANHPLLHSEQKSAAILDPFAPRWGILGDQKKVQCWKYRRPRQHCHLVRRLSRRCLPKSQRWLRRFVAPEAKLQILGQQLSNYFGLEDYLFLAFFFGQVLVFFWIPAYLLFLLTCFSCSLLSLLIFFSAIVLLCLSTYTILLFLFLSHVFLLLHFLLLCFLTSCLYCLFVFHVSFALFFPVCILNKALEIP